MLDGKAFRNDLWSIDQESSGSHFCRATPCLGLGADITVYHEKETMFDIALNDTHAPATLNYNLCGCPPARTPLVPPDPLLLLPLVPDFLIPDCSRFLPEARTFAFHFAISSPMFARLPSGSRVGFQTTM